MTSPVNYTPRPGGSQSTPSSLVAASQPPSETAGLAWRTAGTGLGIAKWARTMDGALVNVLSQLSTALSPDVFWNDYRFAAVLVQGATMARTPVIAAWLLPGPDAAADAGSAGVMVVAGLPESDVGAAAETMSTASPESDASLLWA